MVRFLLGREGILEQLLGHCEDYSGYVVDKAGHRLDSDWPEQAKMPGM